MPEFHSFAKPSEVIARALHLWRVGVPEVATQPEWLPGAAAPADHALAPAGLKIYSAEEPGESLPPFGLVSCERATRSEDQCAELWLVPVEVRLEFSPRSKAAAELDYGEELAAVFCGIIMDGETPLLPEDRWTCETLTVDEVERGEVSEIKSAGGDRYIVIPFTLLCRFPVIA